MDKKEFNSLVLGALLHDIGKFMQRAGLKEKSDDMEQFLCKKNKNTSHYDYRHVLWTHKFFESDLVFFPRNMFDKDTAQKMASNHHSPDSPLQTIVQVADWLSSGFDRPDAPIEEEHDKQQQKYFKKQPLWSIFNRISLETDKKLSIEKYKTYRLKRLSPDKTIYPVQAEDYSEKSYKNLWDDFAEQLKNIPDNLNFLQFIDAVDALLEQYTWCIPANTQEDYPDVSLYDHLRTTSAIAACLYRYHQYDNSLDNEVKIKDESGETEKFLILSADLSGIQNYIFNLSKEQSKGVSKILRARSFYLATVSRAVGFSILSRFGLPNVCNLQDAGGRLLFLLPNIDPVKEKLKEAKREIEKWFFNKFYGALTINFVTYPLKRNDFKQDRFSSLMNRLNYKINITKKQKLNTVFLQDKKWQNVYVANNMSYKMGVCDITGSFPADKKEDFGTDDNEKELNVSNQCAKEKEIGEKLPSAKYIIYSNKDINSRITFFEGTDFEIHVKLIKEDNKLPKPSDESVIRIEKLDYSDTNTHIPIYPVARDVPRGEDEDILTFEQIANLAVDKESKRGSAMLSVLKADVDNLGFIFSKGLGNKNSLSRYVTLSRTINFFFTAMLPELIKNKYPNIYTVFAGGDDLTLIGDWQSIQYFSEKLHMEFQEFTSFNPNITFSAGIAAVHNKYPVRRAIELAEEHLESSKKGEKNSITYFNTTVTWQKYKELLSYAQCLDEAYQLALQEGKGVTMGFLYRLLTYHKMALNVFSGKISSNMHELLWTSQLHYDVARNLKVDKKNSKYKEYLEYEDLIMQLKHVDKMKTLKIPLFSVIYKNRKCSSTKEE